MITERMTPQEMEAELVSENESILSYIEALKVKFRRIVIKSTKFPVCIHKLYTSRRKNKWIIILKANSKKEIGELTQSRYVSYYDTDRGYYVASLTDKGMITYTPHFFSRYAERTGLHLHGISLIAHYFSNNVYCFTARKDIERPDGSKQTIIEGSTEEGVLLGLVQAQHLILARTFITRDMAKGCQVINFDIYESWREELFGKLQK